MFDRRRLRSFYFFFDWRKQFLQIYEDLFAAQEDEDDPRMSEEDLLEKKAEEQKNRDTNRRQSWHTLVYILSDGDVVRFNECLKLNAHLCLTHRLFEITNKNLVKWIKSK